MCVEVFNAGKLPLNVSSWDEIISGLSNIQSVKCLRLSFGLLDRLNIMDNLTMQRQLSTFEKFELFHRHAFGRLFLDRRSLSISNLEFDANVKESCHTVGPPSTSSLHELSINISKEEDLQVIGSLVSDNTSLRVLELIFDGNDFGVSPSLSLSFFNAIRNASYFESIRVNGFITSDAVMESFYNWITSNQMLNTLKVSIFSNISSVGWQSFASAPSSLDRLEDMNI